MFRVPSGTCAMWLVGLALFPSLPTCSMGGEESPTGVEAPLATLLEELPDREVTVAVPLAERVDVDARSMAIAAELEALADHDWAGTYHAGDGLGVNQTLALSPEAGFTFQWTGCLGLYDWNGGSLVARGETFVLSFDHENVREGFQGIAPELTLVRWGPRRYLVPSDEMAHFCSEFNQGREPRSGIRGWFLLRAGDEALAAPGLPHVPEPFREHLVPTAITTTIVAVGEDSRRLGTADIVFVDAILTLDRGRAEGLREGLWLSWVGEADTRASSLVRITAVREHESDAVMTRIGDDAQRAVPGLVLSTGPRMGWPDDPADH